MALTTTPLPNLALRVTRSVDPGPTKATGLLSLTLAITSAVTGQSGVDPAVALSQKVAAGNQVRVAWTVSRNPSDPKAKNRVRSDAIKILGLVKASKLKYGSVLLVATGAILLHGKEKTTVVVRAKYTHPLVVATDWAKVPLAKIWKLPDDKPAVIAPAYR